MPMQEELKKRILEKRVSFVEDEVLDNFGFPKNKEAVCQQEAQ
jgi:hypothetical protein